MLMTYYPASHTIVGELALRWTSTFLYRLRKLGSQSSSKTIGNGSAPHSNSLLARDTQWSRDTLVGSHAPPSAGITGQFSMDFIYQPATSSLPERLVAIECNPRVHTAICLLTGNPRLGSALVPSASTAEQNKVEELDEISYLSSLSLPVMESPPEDNTTDLSAFTSLPPTFASSRIRFYHAKSLLQRAYNSEASPLPQSWIGHDLPARILPFATLLSHGWLQALMGFVHPLWPKDVIATPGAHKVTLEGTSFDLGAGGPLPPFTDPSFAKDDPWPFFALYHLQWPQLLLWQLVVRRNKWSRINVSTARIFEC